MVMRGCHERGMDLYLYGPKDDPFHRERWREPYPRAELDGFVQLVEQDTLHVGFAISPGLSIDVASSPLAPATTCMRSRWPSCNDDTPARANTER